MYQTLKKLAVRPEPYSLMTIENLWTRPHIARQMLANPVVPGPYGVAIDALV